MKKTLIFLLIFLSICSAQNTNGISIALIDNQGFINPILHFENDRWLGLFDDGDYDKYTHLEWYFTSFIKPMVLIPDSTLYLIEKEGYYTRYGFKSNYSTQQSHRDLKFIGIGISKKTNAEIFNLINQESKTFKIVLDIVSETKFPKNRPYTNYKYLSKYFGEELKLKISNIKLWEAESDKFNLFYFYTAIEYGEGTCKSHVNYQGWIKEVKGKYKLINEKFKIDDCDYKLTTNQIPLSLMTIENEFYVLTEEPQWEGRAYNIFGISQQTILLKRKFNFTAN